MIDSCERFKGTVFVYDGGRLSAISKGGELTDANLCVWACDPNVNGQTGFQLGQNLTCTCHPMTP